MKAFGLPTIKSLLGIFLIVAAEEIRSNDRCDRWFAAGKVVAGKSCELDCAVLVTDLGTFLCPSQCRKLCGVANHKSSLGKFVYYPGLTPAERELIERDPGAALKAFIQKTHAELSSARIFPDQGLDDESDAFRHFMWAGLLAHELGPERAKEFLDAHEANPLQLDSQLHMDLFNNEKGVSAAKKLVSEGKWSVQNLENSGLDALRSKNLKVLNPGLKIPEVAK